MPFQLSYVQLSIHIVGSEFWEIDDKLKKCYVPQNQAKAAFAKPANKLFGRSWTHYS